ncbi:MAG: EAL domain-containing protein [Halanaerobiales bacterium]|nr:EAL domain-containing protein [Halanaerobiales bacterium]
MKDYIKKFYLWGIIVLVVISATFFLQYLNNNNILEDNVERMTEMSVNLVDEKIDNYLNKKGQLINDAKNYIAIENHSNQEILNYLELLMNENKDFLSIYFGSKENNMINASGWKMPEGFDLRERPWYKKAVKKDELIYSKAFINASEDDIIITIAAPVYSEKNGEFLGVVAGDVSIDNIISFVEDQNVIEKGFFMLTDSENNVLAHPNLNYNLENGLPKLNNRFNEKINTHQYKLNKVYKITLDQQEGFYSYTDVNNTNWQLSHFIPLNYYTETFNQLLKSFITAFFISLVVILTFFWLQNRYVIRPLRIFDSAINNIDLENNLDYRITNTQNQDFKFLSESINNVLDKAQKYFNELKEKKQSIKYLANHDSLTNLPNRRKFLDILATELDNNKKGVVMLLDLDNFKEINDTMGHVYGDRILIKISEELSKINEKNIFISRFGGDEFLILIKNEEDIKNIKEDIEIINKVFSRPYKINGQKIFIDFSMGISLYPYDSVDVNQLLANADTAMYKAKEISEKNYVFFDQYMTDKLEKEKEIERILREAIDNDGFELKYQPQINLKTGKPEGFEALLRLKNYNITPDKFIPIAEKKGFINDIGRWVTEKAIKQISIWEKSKKRKLSISINFSPYQLNNFDYIEFLEDLINRENITPSLLEIEITESVLLEKKETSITFLKQLKELGVKIVLDDFGKGYSSFNYLTFIPVDKVKLDKSLNDQFISKDNFNTIDSLISLIHSLDLKVVAEGIEDELRRDKLIEVNCDLIQGYIFSKPLKIEEVEKNYDKKFI